MKSTAKLQPGDPGVRKLSELLCFTIYSANLALGKAYKPILEELGLTYTQYIAIIALWEEDNQTVGSLGDKLFLESNTLTPILKKLETMGYVRRQRDPKDERQVRIGLTEAGRRLRQSAFGMGVLKETKLALEDVPKAQQLIAQIRDNLLESTREREQKE
jgi:MarR family transcriptional regulator, organic hydroperoxide resistance regulator